MNDIIWLLYFADISAGMSVVTGLVGFAGIAAWSGVYINATLDWREDAGRPKARLLIPFAALLLFAAALPSKNTFYAIAAMKAGDQLLESETGGKAIKALNAWLDRQIGEPEATNE